MGERVPCHYYSGHATCLSVLQVAHLTDAIFFKKIKNELIFMATF